MLPNKLQKHIKKHTHTHGSMKKTNVSSEVLILPKNLEKCAPEWTPTNLEKDECFERGLDFETKKGGPGSRQHPPTPFAGGDGGTPIATGSELKV